MFIVFDSTSIIIIYYDITATRSWNFDQISTRPMAYETREFKIGACLFVTESIHATHADSHSNNRVFLRYLTVFRYSFKIK